MLKESCPYH
jgi:hypothetical protein